MSTILTFTTAKKSYAVSIWSLSQLNPIQNMQLPNFADSPTFGSLQQKINPENIHPIFENLTSFEIIKLDYQCIKVSPDKRFMKIGNIFRDLHAHEWISHKKHRSFQKLASEIMDIIFGSHLICLICKETTNNQFQTSICSFWYV